MLKPLDDADRGWPMVRAVPSLVPRSWYVGAAKQGLGRKAVHILHERDYEAYQPVETVWVRPGQGRRKFRQWRPLLGRYLFIGVADDQGFDDIPPDYIGQLIRDEQGAPAQVAAAEVERFRTDETLGKFDKTARGRFVVKPGASVKITKGAYDGRSAQVQKVKGERRWQVYLEGLNFPLTIEEEDMAPIEEEPRV